MKVIPAAGPGSPQRVYLVATSCAYSPRLSWASHTHTQLSSWQLEIKKQQYQHQPPAPIPGGMEGHGSRAGTSQEEGWRDTREVPDTHPTRFLPVQTKGLPRVLKMLFSCMECDPFLQQAIGLPFVWVRVWLHDKWPFYCLYTLTCTHAGERGILDRWLLLTSDQQLPPQFKHTISILPVSSLPTNSCKTGI